jgi:phenylalanyl-tRNA synthetase beta chain
MIAPLSWLKQYVPISLDSKILGEKLTEVGLGTERIERKDTDTIFHLEITPNRPDWLSIVGVAREIAAITGKKISYPKLKTDLKPKKNIKLLSLKIHPSFSCSQRMTGIIVDNVMVKESPMWLKEKLLATGQRPINNIVDITNFVMWELGNPIHSFDYDKIDNHEMWVEKAKGGESFESVDEVSYILPKGAIIYKDANKIFDLAGIKEEEIVEHTSKQKQFLSLLL